MIILEHDGATGDDVFFSNFDLSYIYFWLLWVFVAAHRLSLVAVSGEHSSCGSRAQLACSVWVKPVPLHYQADSPTVPSGQSPILVIPKAHLYFMIFFLP